MSQELTMQERLECSRSFADDSPDLRCEMGGICDGTLYDCCLWGREKLEETILERLEAKG